PAAVGSGAPLPVLPTNANPRPPRRPQPLHRRPRRQPITDHRQVLERRPALADPVRQQQARRRLEPEPDLSRPSLDDPGHQPLQPGATQRRSQPRTQLALSNPEARPRYNRNRSNGGERRWIPFHPREWPSYSGPGVRAISPSSRTSSNSPGPSYTGSPSAVSATSAPATPSKRPPW